MVNCFHYFIQKRMYQLKFKVNCKETRRIAFPKFIVYPDMTLLSHDKFLGNHVFSLTFEELILNVFLYI